MCARKKDEYRAPQMNLRAERQLLPQYLIPENKFSIFPFPLFLVQNEINFQYTEADFRGFMSYYYRKGAGRKSLYILGGVGLLAACWPLLNSGFTGASMIAGIIALLLFAGIWYVTLRFSTGRIFKANPQMLEKRRCTFDADHLIINGETFSADYQWNGFKQAAETPEAFLMFTTGFSAVILPKRAFSEAQMRAFRQLAALPG
jgi:hypothetical protein